MSSDKVDVLFVVDDSPGMLPVQDALIGTFPSFIAALEALPRPLDVHIGIVSSDLGAGQFLTVSCPTMGGDAAALQNVARDPRRCGTGIGQGRLNNSTDSFLEYISAAGGGAQQANFTGDVRDAFACYAKLGDQGCMFAQQFAAAWAAIGSCSPDGWCVPPSSSGFLRADAQLVIFLVAGQDDASAPTNSAIWDTRDTRPNSVLGCLTPYRAFEFGNQCGGLPPGREPGPRTDCGPELWNTAEGAYETMPDDLEANLRGLKSDPRAVRVVAITGPPGPVVVSDDGNGCPRLEPSCVGGANSELSAYPAPHLSRLISLFDADRASLVNVCQADLSNSMNEVGLALAQSLSAQCLGRPIKDSDPHAPGLQPECTVEDVLGPPLYTRVGVPPCDPVVCDPAAAPNLDCHCQRHAMPRDATSCWYIWPDQVSCPQVPPGSVGSTGKSVGAGFQFAIDRGIDDACRNPPPANVSYTEAQCSVCNANPSQGSFDCSPGCRVYWPNCCPLSTPGCFP